MIMNSKLRMCNNMNTLTNIFFTSKPDFLVSVSERNDENSVSIGKSKIESLEII